MSRFHAPDPFDSKGWRKKCFDVIFGYETPAGRAFDVALVIVILISVSTVGYGDISPATPFGRFVASFLILIGYGIIAVPTGIYSAELMSRLKTQTNGPACPQCGLSGHDVDAHFCRKCGASLPDEALSR